MNLFSNLLQPKPLLGLDIQPTEICLTQLKPNSQHIKQTAVQPLPAGAILDSRIKNFSQVQSALQELIHTTKTKNHPAAISIPATSVISKRLKLSSYLLADECAIEFNTRLHHYLPGTNEQLCFDFVFLEKTEMEYHNILLTAARQDTVNEYARVVKTAGLQVRIVDIDAYALARAANFFISIQPKRAIVFLEVTNAMANLVIYREQQLIFSQQFSFANIFQIQDFLQRSLQMCFLNFMDSEIEYYFAGENLDELINKLQKELRINIHLISLKNTLPTRCLTSFGLALRSASNARS